MGERGATQAPFRLGLGARAPGARAPGAGAHAVGPGIQIPRKSNVDADHRGWMGCRCQRWKELGGSLKCLPAPGWSLECAVDRVP